MTIDTARLRELASDPNVPKGQWFWLGNHSLAVNHGKRPVVVSGRDLRLRDDATGLLIDFDAGHPVARYLAALSPDVVIELLDRLEKAEAR